MACCSASAMFSFSSRNAGLDDDVCRDSCGGESFVGVSVVGVVEHPPFPGEFADIVGTSFVAFVCDCRTCEGIMFRPLLMSFGGGAGIGNGV